MEGERYKGDGEMKEWREKDIRVMDRWERKKRDV